MTQKRRINSRDLFSFTMVDDPQVSPDGTDGVSVVGRADPAEVAGQSRRRTGFRDAAVAIVLPEQVLVQGVVVQPHPWIN